MHRACEALLQGYSLSLGLSRWERGWYVCAPGLFDDAVTGDVFCYWQFHAVLGDERLQ
jgi:hypothetical protein